LKHGHGRGEEEGNTNSESRRIEKNTLNLSSEEKDYLQFLTPSKRKKVLTPVARFKMEKKGGKKNLLLLTQRGSGTAQLLSTKEEALLAEPFEKMET